MRGSGVTSTGEGAPTGPGSEPPSGIGRGPSAPFVLIVVKGEVVRSGVSASNAEPLTATSRVTGGRHSRVKPSNPDTGIGGSANPQAVAGLGPGVRMKEPVSSAAYATRGMNR